MGNAGAYFYYQPEWVKVRFHVDEANKALLDLLSSFTVPREVSDLYIVLMENTFKVKEGDRDEEVRKWHKQVADLECKLLKIDEMYFWSELEADSYKRLKTRASEDLNQAHRET